MIKKEGDRWVPLDKRRYGSIKDALKVAGSTGAFIRIITKQSYDNFNWATGTVNHKKG